MACGKQFGSWSQAPNRHNLTSRTWQLDIGMLFMLLILGLSCVKNAFTGRSVSCHVSGAVSTRLDSAFALLTLFPSA